MATRFGYTAPHADTVTPLMVEAAKTVGKDALVFDQTTAGGLLKATSDAFSAAGLNASDPLKSEMILFNKNGLKLIDPVMVGRTHVFITRPDLNLGLSNNLVYDPTFTLFAQTPYGRRLMLQLMSPWKRDESLEGEYSLKAVRDSMSIGNEGAFKSRFTEYMTSIDSSENPASPFSPLLSNTCTETSGAKDLIMETFDTQGDFSGSKLSYPKGADETGTVADLTLTFEDIFLSPVSTYFLLWMNYMHHVGKGMMSMDGYYIMHRQVDYTCSIYVLMLDPSQRYIIRAAKYTGAFPTSLNLAAVQHSKDVNTEALRDVSVTMRYNRLEYMNPKIFVDFNKISAAFTNREILDAKGNANPRFIPAPNLTRSESGLKNMARHWTGHPYIVSNELIFT